MDNSNIKMKDVLLLLFISYQVAFCGIDLQIPMTNNQKRIHDPFK